MHANPLDLKPWEHKKPAKKFLVRCVVRWWEQETISPICASHKLVINNLIKAVEPITQVNLSHLPKLDLSDAITMQRSESIPKSREVNQLQSNAKGFVMPVYFDGCISFGDWVRYFKANPGIAQRRWQHMVMLQKKHGWMESCFSETWQALKRALNIDGSSHKSR